METEALTLANVAEGIASEQFQERLAEVAQIFEEAQEYVRNKGVIEAKMVIELDFARAEDSSFVDIAVTTTVKPPKRQRIGRTAIYQASTFSQPQLPKQAPLFDDNVRSLRDAQPEGD